jgi:hypothetical protein
LYGPADPGYSGSADYGYTQVVDESGDPTVAQDVQTDDQSLATDAAADDQTEQQMVAALNATRRPSHADKRRAWRRQLLGKEITTLLRAGPTETEIDAAVQRFL